MSPHAASTAPAINKVQSYLRRLFIAGLTLIFTPFLALLAAVLLVLNLFGRRSVVARPSAQEESAGVSGLASIIVLNWDGRNLLGQCLNSVTEAVKRDERPHEIILVDNGSVDGSAAFVRASFPDVRILELKKNVGFGEGNNEGVRVARHDLVVLLNNDMVVDPDFLRPLLGGFKENTFAVTCQIRHQNPASIQEETGRTAAVFRRGLIDYTHRQFNEGAPSRPYYPVFWAGGGSSAFRRDRFLALGGFSGIFSPAYVEDSDLSFRAWQAGWEVLLAPAAIVYHRHRGTTSRKFAPAKLQSLIQRNQFLFVWKNIRNWPLLLSHCGFLPWNCYRLARDNGLRIWGSLFQAAARLPELTAARKPRTVALVRSEAEIFGLSSTPAIFFARGDRTPVDAREKTDILWVTAYLPCAGTHAGAGRMFELLRRMSGNYRVTLLTFYEEDVDLRRFLPELESVCHKVVAIPRRPPWRWQMFPYEPFRDFCTPDMEQALQDCLLEQDFALIQLEYAQMASYAQRELGIPTLLTVHEVDFAACARRARVETNPFVKLRWFYNYLQVLDRQISLLRRVDAAVYVTDADQREMQKFCKSITGHVINTGVDLDYFRRPDVPPQGNRLVYVGAFVHTPNVDAMLYFCRRIFPLIRAWVPDAELTIVGSDPPPAITGLGALPGVRVTGTVSDIRPYMTEAAVYVVPLRLGVGIRGKILEAWSMAMPVVTTSVGCAGLRCRDGENLMIADTPGEFAHRVVMLLQEPARGLRIGIEGRKVAERYYGWDAIASQIDSLYRRYLDGNRRL